MKKIEFACDISLINEVLKCFGKGTIVKKLNAYTILVEVNAYMFIFKKWANINAESVEVLKPGYLNEEIKRNKLVSIIKQNMEDFV